LAESADLSWRYVQQLEAGRESNPSLRVLVNLKKALGCAWEELLREIT
jgi:transcriptional regulator with XRE-family HTH domain